MSYAIGYVVFGVSLQSPYGGPDPFEDIRKDIESLSESEIVKTPYSGGGGDEPCYFGIDRGQIDECDLITEDMIGTLFASATDEDRSAFQTMLANLGEEYLAFHERIKGIKPSLFITWGSS